MTFDQIFDFYWRKSRVIEIISTHKNHFRLIMEAGKLF